MAKNDEIGFSGLNVRSGRIYDDFLREFHGVEAYKRYNEMRLNDATIGAGLLAVELTLRGLDWTFIGDDERWVQVVEDARAAMSQSWNDFISEAMSFVWAGYSVHEIVYQRDGSRWLWRKFPIRGQDTIHQWLLDETGGIQGIIQIASPTYKAITIPIEKLILFRMRSERNNPEGRSLLRPIWLSYYYLKNLQQIEAIGFERDVNGLPAIKLPQGASVNESDENSDASKAAKIVRNMRNDEQAGLVLPFGWDALLLSGSGKSFAELANAIERYERRIATAFFAQFLMLGQNGVGSYSLSQTSTDFFLRAVDAIADIIAETFSKYAIPRLLKLNGATDEQAASVSLQHTSAGTADVTRIAQYISSVRDMLTIDAEDELWLRQMIGLPEKDLDALEQLRREKPQAPPQAQMTAYAADAPDDDARRMLERKWSKTLKEFFAQEQERILKEARRAAKR